MLVTGKWTWDMFVHNEFRDSSYSYPNKTLWWRLFDIEGDVAWTWDEFPNVITHFDWRFLQLKANFYEAEVYLFLVCYLNAPLGDTESIMTFMVATDVSL